MNMRYVFLGLLVAAIGAGLGFTFLRPAPQASVADAAAPTASTQATTVAISAPKGEVVLTIKGGPNAAGETIDIAFDIEGLKALPVTTFSTTTMWTEGVKNFEGVELKTLLSMLKMEKGTLSATAINDYRIEIPVAEIEAGGPIIAYMMDGDPMSVRDKGPLWLVYPYDSDPKYQSEVVFSRSIWQLNRLEIAP
jgi:hypothetical protein